MDQYGKTNNSKRTYEICDLPLSTDYHLVNDTSQPNSGFNQLIDGTNLIGYVMARVG